MPQKIPGALPVSNEAMGLFSSVSGEEVELVSRESHRRRGSLPQGCAVRSRRPLIGFSDVFAQSLRARARVNVNLELSRSGNGVRNGFRRPDGRGSGQFAESALDTRYVARNRG